MLFLRFLLFLISFGFLVAAAGVVLYDVYLAFELGRLLRRRSESAAEPPSLGEAIGTSSTEPTPTPTLTSNPAPASAASSTPAQVRIRRSIRWTVAAKLAVTAAALTLFGQSIVVIPDGNAGVRISQLSGVRPGTLYAGTHLVFPLLTRVQLYDIRDRVFSTSAAAGQRESREVLTVEAREGLSVGVGVTVRYRIDPSRLDFIQSNLPQPIEDEIVAPVVTSTFRQVGPNYVIREIFSLKREEFRERAAQAISTRLAEDAIVVKEVLVRKIDLPAQYAQGLQNLLLKEQEDDETTVQAQIELKRVKVAESQAEAAKIREIKRAEGDAQARVIQAKAESDSMQYTLPLKQKQIEQSRLEAEARKEATIKNSEAEAAARVKNAEAEAEAKVIDSKAEQERVKLLGEAQTQQLVRNAEASGQAKVIDGKAELQRRNMLADAEAYNTRVTSQAEAEQLRFEAEALKANPLLVQFTVAQRLSDRVQIMMVPTDGKFFFTNDVLRSVSAVADTPLKAAGK